MEANEKTEAQSCLRKGQSNYFKCFKYERTLHSDTAKESVYKAIQYMYTLKKISIELGSSIRPTICMILQ